MPTALIGYTGFVGGNLARQHAFDAFFNSRNIEEIADRHFELVICSGLPAAKWVANREPEADLANARRLVANVCKATIERLVVISSVDVYPAPCGVDEDSLIDRARQHPYGEHRLMLEEVMRARFPSVLVVRLPGLFGPGLRKNAVFDLLHGNEVHKIHSDSVYQWYCVDRLWADIGRMHDAGVELVNFATEPLSVGEITREAFGLEFLNRLNVPPARYDVRTKYDALFGGHGGYIQGRAAVIEQLRAFVAAQRALRK